MLGARVDLGHWGSMKPLVIHRGAAPDKPLDRWFPPSSECPLYPLDTRKVLEKPEVARYRAITPDLAPPRVVLLLFLRMTMSMSESKKL